MRTRARDAVASEACRPTYVRLTLHTESDRLSLRVNRHMSRLSTSIFAHAVVRGARYERVCQRPPAGRSLYARLFLSYFIYQLYRKLSDLLQRS
jgi:hypothetical protein